MVLEHPILKLRETCLRTKLTLSLPIMSSHYGRTSMIEQDERWSSRRRRYFAFAPPGGVLHYGTRHLCLRLKRANLVKTSQLLISKETQATEVLQEVSPAISIFIAQQTMFPFISQLPCVACSSQDLYERCLLFVKPTRNRKNFLFCIDTNASN